MNSRRASLNCLVEFEGTWKRIAGDREVICSLSPRINLRESILLAAQVTKADNRGHSVPNLN